MSKPRPNLIPYNPPQAVDTDDDGVVVLVSDDRRRLSESSTKFELLHAVRYQVSIVGVFRYGRKRLGPFLIGQNVIKNC
jgi:hypothetical protein